MSMGVDVVRRDDNKLSSSEHNNAAKDKIKNTRQPEDKDDELRLWSILHEARQKCATVLDEYPHTDSFYQRVAKLDTTRKIVEKSRCASGQHRRHQVDCMSHAWPWPNAWAVHMAARTQVRRPLMLLQDILPDVLWLCEQLQMQDPALKVLGGKIEHRQNTGKALTV